ncbi:hypothetical protein H310_07935 [Aphanomyces invadans]|uniref:Uncharacterized protein n=1 Tax=Aphanomyces invadans TaxID=157072 RepID=A0A024U143_9STRA|nr:hypothetical protein H310_07935 [Aphanomyces invadans]ETV99904.1 hypothetical protein H310_07935 [Aphanomyces invadans]|eukprot:XP_008871680.1 hypothetical protein H310_07935 [Aphanomyces invadans]
MSLDHANDVKTARSLRCGDDQRILATLARPRMPAQVAARQPAASNSNMQYRVANDIQVGGRRGNLTSGDFLCVGNIIPWRHTRKAFEAAPQKSPPQPVPHSTASVRSPSFVQQLPRVESSPAAVRIQESTVSILDRGAQRSVRVAPGPVTGGVSSLA